MISPGSVSQPDVIFLQRIFDQGALRIGTESVARFAMDFDDDFWHLPMSNPVRAAHVPGSPEMRVFEEALRVADVVTCSTKPLAEAARKYRENIVVVENAISDEHFEMFGKSPITGEPKRAGQIRIGYVGSITHAADLALVEKALWKIMRRYPQVHFVSAGQYLKPHEAFLDRCEWDRGIAPQPGESGFDFMVRYYQLIESLDIDIALAPLEHNKFNEGKSNVKLLEMGMCGLPVIASPVGPYAAYASPIWTADTTAQWVICLERLIESGESRKGLAECNRGVVESSHLISARADAWEAALTR